MILLFGLLLIVIGSCMTSSGRDYDESERRAERRHNEMKQIVATKMPAETKKTKVTKRRILKDKEGNVIAEEIIEEVL